MRRCAEETILQRETLFGTVQDRVLRIQQHWVECLREGREPETSGRDNLKTLELVHAAYRSAESGEVKLVPRSGRPEATPPGSDARSLHFERRI